MVPVLAMALVAAALLVIVLFRPGMVLNTAPPRAASQDRPGRPLTDCARSPHQCGFPDATNTGVPVRTRLRKVPGQVSSGPGWYYDHRGFVAVVGTGAVLSGLSISCGVSVTGSHVTIRDVKIVTGGQSAMGIALRHVQDVTIKDSTIAGSNTGSGRLMVGVKDVYGDARGTRLLDDDIFQATTGVQIYQGLIQGTYIHHLGMISSDHVNGVTTNGDTQPLVIRHNTIFDSFAQTDAIGLFQDFGVVANVTIDDNLLAGGGYSIYGGEGSKGRPSHIVVTGNRISTKFFRHGGYWGPAVDFDTRAPGDAWSGNVWDSTDRPVPAP
ncbi:MAG: hypothetical protein ACR2MP_17155 [Streptosporangiaceae bacterium]